jgi:ketosteroid isomerase-like protein
MSLSDPAPNPGVLRNFPWFLSEGVIGDDHGLVQAMAYSRASAWVLGSSGRYMEEPSSGTLSLNQRRPGRESIMAQMTATEVRAAIMAANEKFMATFSRGDAAGCAACYTEQAQILPPNSDIIMGKQAIQTFWQGAMNMGITAAKLETLEVKGHGNTANEVGQYTLQGTGARRSTRASTSSYGNKRRGSGGCTVISGIAAGQR